MFLPQQWQWLQQIKLQQRRQKPIVDTAVADFQEIDTSAQRDLMIQQLLDQAFMINNTHVRDYVVSALRDGKRISTQDLPIHDAKQLLAMAHVIEVGAANSLSSNLRFRVEPTGNRITNNDYYNAFDEFTIELIEDANTALNTEKLWSQTQ